MTDLDLNAATSENANADPTVPPVEVVRFDPLDLTIEPPEPVYLALNAIERNTVVMLAGDTGAAKTLLAMGMAMAGVRGEDFLGAPTNIDRVIYIDEENPSRIAAARMRALGFEAEHAGRLRYYNRNGILLGPLVNGKPNTAYDEWIRQELDEFHPDLVVVDGVMAATTNSEVGNNNEIVAILKYFRALSEEFGVTFLLLHHERKQQAGETRNASQQTMGGRQWVGQIDTHVVSTFRKTVVDDLGDDVHRRRTTVTVEIPKVRDGWGGADRQQVQVTSHYAGFRLVTTEIDTVTDETLVKLVETVATQGPLRRGKLAEALEMDDDGSFDKLLRRALKAGYLKQPAPRRPYELGDAPLPGHDDRPAEDFDHNESEALEPAL